MSQALSYRRIIILIIVRLCICAPISTVYFLIFHRPSVFVTELIDGLSVSHSLPLS